MEEITIASNLASEGVDFSMFSLFLRADLVVKSVIIILIISSIYSWHIIVSKLIRIQRLNKLNIEFDEIFWSGNSFEDLYETFNYNQTDPKSRIFCSGWRFWRYNKRNSPKIFRSLNGLGVQA